MAIKVVKYVVVFAIELDMDSYDEGTTEQDVIEMEKNAVLDGDIELSELWADSVVQLDEVTVTVEDVEDA